MSETAESPTTAKSFPDRVGVMGGGRMGAGIAHAFLSAGATVIVVDINDDALEAARNLLLDRSTVVLPEPLRNGCSVYSSVRMLAILLTVVSLLKQCPSRWS